MKNHFVLIFCLSAFLGLVLALPFLGVRAQEKSVEEGLALIDKAISFVKAILNKLSFIKSVWERIRVIYEQAKDRGAGFWDKYLDRYLGKYIEILKENIKQGLIEEKEEIKDIFKSENEKLE